MASDTITVKSADRVFDILEFLAEKPGGVGYADLAAALGIPKSSLFPLLRNLVSRGYVSQSQIAGAYRLGRQLQHLVAKIEAPPLISLVAPYVEAASRELNETVAFYQRRQDQVRAGFVVNGDQALRFAMTVGAEAPLYAVSSGRAILAAAFPEHRDAFLQYICPEPITSRTKLEVKDIREAVEEAVISGIAYERDEQALGIVGIARAVLYGGAPSGAVGFMIPSARFDEAYDLVVRQVLRATTAAIEAAMNDAGYKL